MAAPDADAPVAAVDLGTNSFHLVVARPSGNGRFEILDREKEVVRLGSGSGDMKVLQKDAVERGVAALARFRRIADSFGAELHAVATSAVREADNRDEFLHRVSQEAGIRVEVISGTEEARLIHLGVLQAVPVYDQRVLVVDIGGGSTEFALGLGEDVLDARSLKLGAIRLTERFFRNEPVKPKVVAEARRWIRSFLTPVTRMVAHAGGFDVAVGSSGTIQNVVEIVHARAGRPLRQVSGATFTADELADVVKEIVSRPRAADRVELAGLDPKRADIILGGVLVLEQAVEALGIREMVVSDFALREGVLLDALRRRQSITLGHLRELRYESVLHVLSFTPGEREHAERVADLAVQLFEATRPWHGLDERWEELLEAAGLLHNVGLAISHDRHHLHSYYIIRNTDLLKGFTDHEVEVIALVARYHRKSAPRARHAEYAALDGGDQRAVRVLGGVLRIAVGLDRTREGVVRAVRARAADGAVLIEVDVDGDADLELYAARQRADVLADALGARVEVETG